MRTILFIIAFIATCSGQGKDCELNLNELAKVSRTIVEWIGNGYTTNVNPKACKNGLIYGDCLAGFLHKENEECSVQYASEEVLPKCTKLFKKDKYSEIRSKISWLKLNTAISLFGNFLSDAKLNPLEFCYKLKSYVKKRISASEGGHYDKSKMVSFCEKKDNEIVCNRWDDFLNNRVKYLESAMKYLYEFTLSSTNPKDYAIKNKNAIEKFINALVKFTLSADKEDRESLSACLNEFVEQMLEHMT